MNQLDPELRRLIRWARQAPAGPDPEPSYGFATRVAARCRAAGQEAEPGWAHRLRWSASGLSLLIVAAGLAFWLDQRQEATNAYNVVPTLQLAAHNLAP